MAGFDDLISEAQPALCAMEAAATAGRTWRFTVVLRDYNGDLIDLSAFTADCTVYTSRSRGGLVTILDTQCNADGTLVLTSAVADNAFTASETSKSAAWACTLTRTVGPTTDIVQLWRATDSPFRIDSERGE